MTGTQDPTATAESATQRGNASPPSTRRAMLGLGLGNTLEWYDWMIFGLLAAFIGPQFFPSQDPVSSTLDALAVFAVGFCVRPLGGVLLGNVADRIGRRRVMLWSVGIMAATTLGIALLPSYDSIGVFFQNFGILLASLVSFATSYTIGGDAMPTWGWRVPMLVGAAMSFFVLYLRRALPETLSEEEKAERTSGTWEGVRRHWLGLAAIIFVVGAAQAYNYAWNVGLPSLARGTYGENPTTIFAVTSILGVIMLVGSIITGRIADRVCACPGRSLSLASRSSPASS
ncbi:MFS transporter [Rhodococcus koreensis]|uniref:MFS transporter n=1 Tax=Rhodococcus koreensis TaxID=99653 RepID=UPI00366EC19A